MKRGKIITGTVVVTALTFLSISIGDFAPLQKPDAFVFPEHRAENNSVYLAGCQTYPKDPPRTVVYNTVIDNFVTWPCALEVPPPDGALEWERHNFVMKK